MGSSQVRQGEYDLRRWVVLHQSGNSKLLRHLDSGDLIQESVVFVQAESIERQRLIYAKRKALKNTVKVFGIVEDQQGGICARAARLKVYSEHVTKLLAEEEQLPCSQALKYLRDALLGFRAIAKHYTNYFTITPRMIGRDKDNGVRVWLNENFAVNYAADCKRLVSSKVTSQRIAGRIFQLIREKMEGKAFPQRLQQFAQSNGVSQLDLDSGVWLVSNYLGQEHKLSVLEQSQSLQTWRSLQNSTRSEIMRPASPKVYQA